MKQLVKRDERTVAYRALCLGAFVKRGEIESTYQQAEVIIFGDTREKIQQKQRDAFRHLTRWIDEEQLDPYFTETERNTINQPVGTWTGREIRYAKARVEALGTLLWALGRVDYLPSYDELFNADDVMPQVDVYGLTIDFVWLASLRDCEALCQHRDEAEMWNWRSRARELERLGLRPPEGVSFREIVRFTTERAHQNGLIQTPCDGDFPAFGKPYLHASEDEFHVLNTIASQRYSVLNWLCDLSDGGASRYF